jgi:hypothetical protein
MGPVNSKNITKNTINEFINVLNETIQSTSTSGTLANLVDLNNCTVTGMTIDQTIGYNDNIKFMI